MTWQRTDRSLCQLRGISREAEARWQSIGVKCVDMLQHYLALHGPDALFKQIESQVALFHLARQLEMTDVIVSMFPVGARARVIADRLERSLFFDIETDGVGPHAAVTLIATIMNGIERVFVRGVDLVEFLELWNNAEVIVSFNGKRFDVPVLMREFYISKIPAHVDLMEEGRRFGLSGGLKKIEKTIGFVRAESACRNGFDAVALWQDYKRNGDVSLLETLKRYNVDDVRSLVHLYRYLLPLESESIFDP